MVLLSFTYFRNELITRTKDHTTRPFTHERFLQLLNAKQYECWWRSRSPDGYKLYNAVPIEPPYVLSFERTVMGVRAYFSCTVYPYLTVEKTAVGFIQSNSTPPGEKNTRTMTEAAFRKMALRDGFSSPAEMVLHFVGEYGLRTFNRMFIGIPFKAVDGLPKPL